jgi:hypothetical protein
MQIQSILLKMSTHRKGVRAIASFTISRAVNISLGIARITAVSSFRLWMDLNMTKAVFPLSAWLRDAFNARFDYFGEKIYQSNKFRNQDSTSPRTTHLIPLPAEEQSTKCLMFLRALRFAKTLMDASL